MEEILEVLVAIIVIIAAANSKNKKKKKKAAAAQKKYPIPEIDSEDFGELPNPDLPQPQPVKPASPVRPVIPVVPGVVRSAEARASVENLISELPEAVG